MFECVSFYFPFQGGDQSFRYRDTSLLLPPFITFDSVFGALFGRRSARLQHRLHEAEADAGLRLVLRQGEVVGQVVVALASLC